MTVVKNIKAKLKLYDGCWKKMMQDRLNFSLTEITVYLNGCAVTFSLSTTT